MNSLMFTMRKTFRRLPIFVSDFMNNTFPRFPTPMLDYQLVGHCQPNYSQNDNESPNSVFDEVILKMAAPKSKVSPSRKKMKHGKYIPDRVEWALCERCGESKRPHRICTKNIDICAMRPEDWEVEKLRREKPITSEDEPASQ